MDINHNVFKKFNSETYPILSTGVSTTAVVCPSICVERATICLSVLKAMTLMKYVVPGFKFPITKSCCDPGRVMD